MFFVFTGAPLARRALRPNHALALSGISRSSPTQGGPSDCLRPPMMNAYVRFRLSRRRRIGGACNGMPHVYFVTATRG